MTALRHHSFAILISVLVVLTGQAAAMAHGAPGPMGQVELCTGDQGPVMVYLDETGAPTGPPVYCPEFALSLILSIDPVVGVFGPDELLHSVFGVDFAIMVVAGHGIAVPRVRGPPVWGFSA